MIADITPWQYLIGIGLYVWMVCMLGALVMSIGLPMADRMFFLLIMGIGFIISVIVGACIGIFSKNQMMSTSLVMPFMMIFSFALCSSLAVVISRIKEKAENQKMDRALERYINDNR